MLLRKVEGIESTLLAFRHKLDAVLATLGQGECMDCHHRQGICCDRIARKGMSIAEAHQILSEGCRDHETKEEVKVRQERVANQGGCGECVFWSRRDPGFGVCDRKISHSYGNVCAYDYTCGYHRTMPLTATEGG